MTNNLRKVLDEKGISAYKMAADLGKPYTTIYNWVKSDNLTPKTMGKIADYLKEPVTYIFEL